VDTTVITQNTETMFCWLTTARAAQQAGGMVVAIKREDRKKMSVDALVKLQKSTREGLTQKFTLMTHSTDD
jgi:hypothetical protein